MTLTTSSPTTEFACGTRAAATACVDVLREVVTGLDPDATLAAEAPEVWSLFDQVEKLGAAAKMLLARRVEESSAWKDAGMRSAAEYLASQGGTTRDAARDTLKTSKRLRDLPQVEDAMRRGELSDVQAHAIADAASHNPACEAELLDHAKVNSLKELRNECLRKKAAADPEPEATRERIYKERRFRLSTDAEGAWRLYGRGPLDHAGTFSATLNPLIDHQYKKARAAGKREERDAYAYDALQEMARLAHASIYGYDLAATSTSSENTDSQPQGPGADSHGDADPEHPSTPSPTQTMATEPQLPGTGDEDDGDGRVGASRAQRHTAGRKANGPTRQPNPTHLALLRLDLTALRRGWSDPGETCELTGIGPLPVTAARELLARSIIKLVITEGTTSVSVTHIGNGSRAAALLGAPPLAPQPEDKQVPPIHLALIHLATRDLHAHSPQGESEEDCTIPGAGPVPATAARDLLGPSLLGLVRARGVAVAGHVHKGRKATVAQRMALLWAQPECSVLGCPHTFVQIDHRLDWAKTHVTRLEALDRLCVHHHRMKTYQGWALVPGTGKRPMAPPDDPRHTVGSQKGGSRLQVQAA